LFLLSGGFDAYLLGKLVAEYEGFARALDVPLFALPGTDQPGIFSADSFLPPH